MWMSALWVLTVTGTLDAWTPRAPTPAHVSTRTLEMAKTAQVTGCQYYKDLFKQCFPLILKLCALDCVFPSTSKVPESRLSRLWSQRGQQLPDGWRGCVWLHERLWIGWLFPPPLPGNWKLGQSIALLQRWVIARHCQVMISA